MEQAIMQKTNVSHYAASQEMKSFFSRFIDWATNEEEDHHIGWVGVEVTSMSAVFFPLTMGCILLNGASFPLIIASIISFVLVVVINLAALPTRYTIPLFILGILADIFVIISSFFIR